jgi:uncharacterized protein YbcI
MAASKDQPRGSSLHAALSDMVMRVTADYTGRGPTRARTTINGEWVFVTLSETLTKGERKLATPDAPSSCATRAERSRTPCATNWSPTSNASPVAA